MVLMEWEALWKLYKDCSPFKALYRWHYWYIWLLGALGIVLSVGGGVVSIWREFLWGAILCVSLFWLTAWLVSRMIDKSFEREFAMLYTTYGVKHSSGLRWGYLYYVHFVDRLAEHNYTRQDGVCSGCVRKPVIATIVQKSKPSRLAYCHTDRLVKSMDCARGFAGPFSDTC